MSSSSLEVKIENGTRSSTLRFFHLTGFLSSQRKELKTLSPPSGEVSFFVFQFEKGTNEFIDVEYKVEMENQENETVNVRRRAGVNRGTYKSAGVRIDSTILRDNSRISVVDSEAAQGSSRKKFELRTEPRAVQYEAGWLVTFIMILYTLSGLKYAIIGFKDVCSGIRNLISVTQPPVPTAEPPTVAAEPPANAAETPANAAETPVNAAETPANAAETPANAAEAPANAAEAPANATEPPAIATEPPVDGTDAGWVQMVPVAVSSVINYVSNLKIWTHLYSANPNESTLPI